MEQLKQLEQLEVSERVHQLPMEEEQEQEQDQDQDFDQQDMDQAIKQKIDAAEHNNNNNIQHVKNDSTTSSTGGESQNTKRKYRSVGRWYIGETLGKGGYSWVKKGYDKKTSKCVALKFMAKADQTWAEEQKKQVVTEIDSLKQIRHPNVMKLYAYNMNAKYPTQNDEKIECILLVLEFAPGGELFDILYYTSALEVIIARSYFRQFIAGLEACHKAGVAHRDLKPQNLLLDSKFNLKITDFGLSKVFAPDANPRMVTNYVGTKGYQAPELLLSLPYTFSADVFSAGVVLFILLTGYPPFEQAHKSDRWFRPLAKGEYDKFWELHASCPISNDPEAKDLLQGMLAYNPKHRMSIADIKRHPWFNGKYLEGKDLVRGLRNRYRQMEQKRRKDAKKLKDLQNSITRSVEIEGLESHNAQVPLYPQDEVEGIWDTHTTAKWKDVYNAVNTVVHDIAGHTTFNFEDNTLTCSVKLQNPHVHGGQSLVRFITQVFLSREFQHGPTLQDSDSDDDNLENSQTIYVVRFRRLEGDVLDWKKILNQVLYKKCTSVLTGLPKWARSELNKVDAPALSEDDYDNVLTEEGIGF